MPFLTIHTNKTSADKQSFVEKAAAFVAAELHKPVSYVIVELDVNGSMSFAGSADRNGALVEMRSIGFNDVSSLAGRLTDFITAELGVEKQLVNIEFIDMPASTLSIGGRLMG